MWRSRHDRLTRRQVFAAAAGLAAARPAKAHTKASQQDAEYLAGPKGNFSCEMCNLFRPPHDCEVVSAEISPHGWCKFFVIPD